MLRVRSSMVFHAGTVFGLAALLACATAGGHEASSGVIDSSASALDGYAERYIGLVLALGEHEEGYVDHYYGPPEWKEEAQRAKRSLEEIGEEAQILAGELTGLELQAGDSLVALRRDYLVAQTRSVATRATILSGRTMGFDEESRALYDAVAPPVSEADLQALVDRVAERFSGDGPLRDRVQRWRKDFFIPPDRVERVFRAAFDACRERTRARIPLPEGEGFRLEYVRNKPWAGYNQHRGDLQGLVQINLDLPKTLAEPLHLGCHEAYPGHHVYNVLMEEHLVRDRGWLEYTVLPLYSPHALLHEGIAEFGYELAFPVDDRVRLGRDVLFPLAGLDHARAEEFFTVYDMAGDLVGLASVEAARRWQDGRMDETGMRQWLERYALFSPEAIEKALVYLRENGTYAINYTVGKALVRRYVERYAATGTPEARWAALFNLLSTPRTPSQLRLE